MNRWLRNTSIIFCSLAFLGACDDRGAHAATNSTGAAVVASTSMAGPVEAFQTDLLDLAFRATLKFPLDPQIKNRCREQESVVAACLELGLTDLAIRYTKEIKNWRKGVGYAMTAKKLVEQGKTEGVETYLKNALQATALESGPGAQAWRIQRIQALVATVHSMLGEDAKAQEIAGMVQEEAQRDVLVLDEARTLRGEDFDDALARVDAVIEAGSFEPVTAQLRKCVLLYDRFFDVEDRRAALEDRIRNAALKSTPAIVRIELVTDAARVAAEHGDRAKSEELIDHASELMAESPKWNPEFRLPLDAAIAEVLHAAGATEKARRRLESALAFFDENRSLVINMFRGNALRPIAEAYHAIGDTESAFEVYGKVLEEAFENPNARPRAMDFIATCCSLAVHRIEPTAELRERLKGILDEKLDHPW